MLLLLILELKIAPARNVWNLYLLCQPGSTPSALDQDSHHDCLKGSRIAEIPIVKKVWIIRRPLVILNTAHRFEILTYKDFLHLLRSSYCGNPLTNVLRHNLISSVNNYGGGSKLPAQWQEAIGNPRE